MPSNTKKSSSIQVARSLRQFLRTDVGGPNTVLGSLSSTRLLPPISAPGLASPSLADYQRRSARYVHTRTCASQSSLTISLSSRGYLGPQASRTYLSTTGSSTQTRTRTQRPHPASTASESLASTSPASRFTFADDYDSKTV